MDSTRIRITCTAVALTFLVTSGVSIEAGSVREEKKLSREARRQLRMLLYRYGRAEKEPKVQGGIVKEIVALGKPAADKLREEIEGDLENDLGKCSVDSVPKSALALS